MRALFRHGFLPLVRSNLVRPRSWAAPALLALALSGAGCSGEGVGQLSGTLFVRGCAPLDPTIPGSRDVPSPIPSYTMDPSYFFAELLLSTRFVPSTDPPGPARMRIRMQSSSPKFERADGFELLVYDLENLATRQASAMASGLAGMPITPPPLDVTPVPPPPDPASTVRASLVFNGSCDYPMVAPLLRGYVHFSEIGQNTGDTIAGDFALTIEDLRAQREQGTPAPSPDVAGALSGTFRFPIRQGPAVGSL